MHQRRSGLSDAVDLAGRQVDGMPVNGAGAKQAMCLVSVKIVAGLGKQRLHPGNLGRLFAEVGLHEAIGILGPERAEGTELIRRRGW